MTLFGKTTIVTATVLSAVALSAASAIGGVADNTASILTQEEIAPFINDASAVIYAPGLAQGSLFRLRGAVGSAWFTRVDDSNNWCDVADMRLLSGDFGGNTVGVSRTEPVVLIALNPDIATRLSQGKDVVTDDYSLLSIEQAEEQGLAGIDILVAGSGSADGNFILNPGSNLLSDIFGTSSTGHTCEHNSAHAAITAK